MQTQTVVVRPNSGVLPFLIVSPVVCFAGALLTDIAYAVTANIQWSDFSDWLLAAGMALGVIGLVVGLASLIGRRRALGWPLVLGGVAVLIVAFVNNLVHSRDAWTSVVPEGLALSALTILLALATAWASASHNRTVTVRSVETRR